MHVAPRTILKTAACVALLASFGLPAAEEDGLLTAAAILPAWSSGVLFALALATCALLAARPGWAWLTGGLWLGAVGLLTPWMFHGSPRAAFWVAAVGGGALALAVSLTEHVGRPSPGKPVPLDLSVFD